MLLATYIRYHYCDEWIEYLGSYWLIPECVSDFSGEEAEQFRADHLCNTAVQVGKEVFIEKSSCEG